jgi:hypothetical protein
MRAKLSLLLEAAQKGLAQNSTATPEDVLVFVSGVLESVVPAEAAAVERAEAAAETASRGEGGSLLRNSHNRISKVTVPRFRTVPMFARFQLELSR